MTQELAIRDDGFAVSERSSATLLKGSIVKFVDGIYKANKTEILEQAPQGPVFVVVRILTAWVHWQGGRPIEHKITHAGQSHPWREELGDDDRTEWELGVGGLPSDPWRDTRYVYLIGPHTAKTYTFVTDSVGGRQAVGELKEAIMTARHARPDALPVVQLAASNMKTKYGVKPRPDFKIVDWRSGTPTAARQIEQRADDDDTFGEPFSADKEAKTVHPFDDDIPF
jgi:hypothetical protein